MSRLATSLLRACSDAAPGPSRLPSRAPRLHRRTFINARIRRYATDPIPADKPVPCPANAHPHPAFESLATELSNMQPCFGARGDEVELLTSPEKFRTKLLEMIKRAKKRILISSLYIGTEDHELIEAIRQALESQPQLRVVIMLDYHRSTRLSPDTKSKLPPSTAHLLLPLLHSHHDRCEVWLFRSPKLRGLMERIVPERFDEGWGTWHCKWYGVDDEVIISGANLAQSYFTNRQDRYIHFRSHPFLLSYLSSLTRLFTHYSYLLTPSPPLSANRAHLVPLPSPPALAGAFGSATLIWPQASIHPRRFAAHAKATITAFQNSWRSANASRLRRVDVDTHFWPVIQAGVLGLHEEEAGMGLVWNAINQSQQGEGVEVDLTSGYFGLYKAYKQAVVTSSAPVRVIAASPKANGFYGSKGLSRLIPEGYTLLESRFYADAANNGRTWDATRHTGVRLREWEREGWTYHAKGMWLSPATSNAQPFLTFIGSSNLSTRSMTLDTELSMLLMTSSTSLRKALSAEVKALDEYAVDVGRETWATEERKVSILARVLIALGVDGML
ncbi:putative CDP-diacylglycerol-glycerol-3-phosphate 3-phosphatidyltransferase [Naematelia encephala]|uniref:CDP-diacylglycerol--glycerol-3-phosphate 3-phosphatidyltransferase n=1 Tax=Naematelia encephala TaxID=71784 RepID=A0A1Y2ASV1_9TREE|nr:putative CDP-diacylglycerol-glycerol-3-phosphate 3-phosphatidyltransferase [Naematelia encephala]